MPNPTKYLPVPDDFPPGRAVGAAPRPRAEHTALAAMATTRAEFLFFALVICALMLTSSLQPKPLPLLSHPISHGPPSHALTAAPAAQPQPPEPVQPPLPSTGRPPRSSGSGGATATEKRLRVRLIMLVINVFPVWWPFLVESYRHNHPSIELLVVHANVSRPEPAPGTEHVQYAHRSVPELLELFSSKLSVPPVSLTLLASPY